VLAVAASACADGGLVIEVTPTDPMVDSVRLYLGGPDRTEGVTLDLPIGSGPNGVVHGQVTGVTSFPRDANNELDVQAVKAGGTAKFVLVRDGVTDLGAVVAVGFAGTEIREVATLFDVHLPAKRFDQYSLTLAPPARPPVAWSDRSPVPASEATCIGITDPATKHPFSASYIVTPDDPDCDGLAGDDPAECNNAAWFGKRPASLEELTCLIGDAMQSSCYLGGPECIDGKPPMPGQCVPTHYCVPKAVCSACAGKLTCAQDITTNPTASILGFGFDCPLAIENGNACEDELVLTMGPIDGLNCTAALIGDATHPFADHIDLPEQSIYVKIDDGCRLRVQVKGKAPDSNTATIGLMVAVDLENGRGVAVPIVLKVDRASGQCTGTPKTCAFDAAALGPSLLDCATSWSPPMAVPGLVPAGVSNVRSPTVTRDGLELFFVADDTEVWRSIRSSRIDPWHAPERVLALGTQTGSGFKTTVARISPDGGTMYLASNRLPTMGGSDVFVARRTSLVWSPPAPLLDLNTQNDETGASVDGTESLLVFDRVLDDPISVRKLFLTTRAPGSTAPWPAGTQIPGTGPMANDLNPHITESGRNFYFASDSVGTAGLELFTLERTGNTFTVPRRIPGLSSPQDESDPWVSADQREIYFASNRTGAWRIYRATR